MTANNAALPSQEINDILKYMKIVCLDYIVISQYFIY